MEAGFGGRLNAGKGEGTCCSGDRTAILPACETTLRCPTFPTVMAPKKNQITVGWREWVALPDLGIATIKAKVDTGARSSALHAYGMERFKKGGESWIRFRVHPMQKNTRLEVISEARVIDERRVKSSSGNVTLRPVVLTTLEWFDETREIELSLTRRDAMGFRLLLGREALRGRSVIDPGRSYLGGRVSNSKAKAGKSK